MNTAIVAMWRQPSPGREAKALEYAQKVNTYWEKAAADGKCSPPETFFSRTGKSIWMVKGEFDTLRELQDAPEGRRLEGEGLMVLSDFTVEFMPTGEAGAQYMADYAATAASLGYM